MQGGPFSFGGYHGYFEGGTILLQEDGERLCHELKPNLNMLLYRITGLRLLDICVGLFVERREKIYLLSNAVRE